MSREWKPGDVAMVSIPSRGEVIAMYTDGAYWETPWAECDGETAYKAAPAFSRGLTGRPLVTIDPEDFDQIARMIELLSRWSGQGPATVTERWQAALREFADPRPPKPEEPLGLGAVVETASGVRYSRVGNTSGCWLKNDSGMRGYLWTEIDAVKVLSEGVQ